MSEPDAPILRVATYNVRSCVGMDGQRSESRIADVIRSLSADVVGLQELDFHRQRSAGIDQVREIALQLGWRHLFHPAMTHADEQYGDAIISKHPLTPWRTAELPGPAPWYCRETRAVQWAKAETPFGAVHVLNTHFGLGRRERMAQAEVLASEDWTGSTAIEDPLVLLGDFNALPGSRPHRVLTRHLHDVRTLLDTRAAFRTFPTKFPSLAVDHIFVNKKLRPISLSVFRSDLARVASDHYPLVAELVLAT
ncbi:endonuclease/exonuclease/phosphatase family protein [soil metagenome]|nr:endonuclease/exonuclease/phosphatase family protein [Chthoniobacterales bacterium]